MGDQSFVDLCCDGGIEEVQAAINNGADVNEEDYSGTTGLMSALANSQNNVVQLLLEQPQIDINKVDQDGSSALHWALYGDNHEGLAALLARHDILITSINQRDQWGNTPIMESLYQWNHNTVNCFHMLLNNPLVDLDTRDNYERTRHEVRR